MLYSAFRLVVHFLSPEMHNLCNKNSRKLAYFSLNRYRMNFKSLWGPNGTKTVIFICYMYRCTRAPDARSSWWQKMYVWVKHTVYFFEYSVCIHTAYAYSIPPSTKNVRVLFKLKDRQFLKQKFKSKIWIKMHIFWIEKNHIEIV